jgi:pyruvate,water dikinase
MTRQGLPVPPGFVLSASFFDPWLEILAAQPEWNAAQTADGKALESATRALQSRCRSLPFHPQQQTELDQALQAFQAAHAGRLFAVR